MGSDQLTDKKEDLTGKPWYLAPEVLNPSLSDLWPGNLRPDALGLIGNECEVRAYSLEVPNMSSMQNVDVETSSSTASFETTRRKFLMWMVAGVTSLVALFLAVPFIGSLIGPSLRVKKAQWVKVGGINSLTADQPVNIKFPFRTEDAYIRETVTRDVWVIKHSPSEVTVFSPICPHLGCHYDWDPGTKEFVCPCHGSIYSIDGKILGGPAPRPLDTLPVRLERGDLFVEWEQFKVGIPEKVRV